jgi:hypothetical protein
MLQPGAPLLALGSSTHKLKIELLAKLDLCFLMGTANHPVASTIPIGQAVGWPL